MKTLRTVIIAITAAFIGLILHSCNDSKSYSELLTDETKSVNTFLAKQHVITKIPADSVFETGPDAPYYQLDEEASVYMQVLSTGDTSERVRDDQLVYFYFTRYNLHAFAQTGSLDDAGGWGNSDDLSVGSASFRFNNYSLSASAQWGSALQMPLQFPSLGLGCEVNLVVKSQYGLTSEIAQVIPFLYNVRYFRAKSN
ncbi:MAG: DUF4827 domain-containing protein [Muribaculaceae bacterium]|nr:DUF4827 domain-containing protein [Muribaculaceae bacterium]